MLKTITNFKIHQNFFKYWCTLWHFAIDDPVHLPVKFIYFEKATSFCEISTFILSVRTVDKSKEEISQKMIRPFCGLLRIYELYLSDTCQCIAQHMNKVWLIWPNKEKTIHHFIWGAIACYGLALHTQSYDVYAMQEIMYKHVGIYVLLDAIYDWSLRWDIPMQFQLLIPALDTTSNHFYVFYLL